MRFGGKLWISQLLGLNIVSESTYFQLLLKMSVLLEEQQAPTRLSWRTLGLCQQMPTLGEEMATDRKFEFIQVLKRKLTESS